MSGAELSGQVDGGSVPDLVWGTAGKGGVRHDSVMLGNIEEDELMDLLEGGQVVKEEPAIFAGAPPGLYQTVGEFDIDLGKNAAEGTVIEEGVDDAVEVLDAVVDEELSFGGLFGKDFCELFSRALQDDAGAFGGDCFGQVPGENTPGEVVDDGVKIEPGPVEESDDGDVGVNDLTRGQCADAEGWPGGMAAQARPAPAPLPNEAAPGSWRDEDAPDALSMASEGGDREVPVFVADGEVVDGGDLADGKRLGRGLGTGGKVSEGAGGLSLLPAMVAGLSEPDQLERSGQGQVEASLLDGGEDLELGRFGGHTRVFEAEVEGLEDGEHKAQSGIEGSDAASQLDNISTELVFRAGAELKGDDRFVLATKPRASGRQRDADVSGKAEIACVPNELAEAVIVGGALHGAVASNHALAAYSSGDPRFDHEPTNGRGAP